MNDSDDAAASNSGKENKNYLETMTVMSIAIATVGVFANINVVVVMLRQRKLRQKIPNIFIINQVRLPLFW